ncbi:sensor histidine kinase [Leadbettera azotonutricia]|nr:histidine kinase [Leadbettera azotonutricia]
MKFRTRLILTYSLLFTIVLTLIAIIFETYNLQHLEQTTRLDLDVLSKNMSQQLDEIVRPMRFITEFLLSDSKTLSAITILTRADRSEPGAQVFITKAKADVTTALATYCNTANFYRVTFFSEYGDILTSNVMSNTIPDGYAQTDSLSSRERVDAAMGKALVLSPYDDPWDPRSPRKVFSITRLVMGNNVSSYLEVQKPYADLEAIYRLDSTRTINAAALNSRGEVLFSQFDEDTTELLGRMITENPSLKAKPLDRIRGNMAAYYYSPYTDVCTIVIQGSAGMNAAIRDITRITILMALLLCGISIFLVFVLSTRVTAPIRRLIFRMDQTNLDNTEELTYEQRGLPAKFPADDEFVQLYQSYNHLIKRLNLAKHKEGQMSLLHLQSEFDALQAQVNPHFLYNVLNVISHQGLKSGNETICEICEELASMLRYSAGTSRRLVTVREELDYVRHYLYLLKTRYLNKLSYEVDAQGRVMEQEMPKIVVQQLVENAVTHGYKDTGKNMLIGIRGWIEDGFWFIEVKNNGDGFDPAKKAQLEQQMAELRNRIQEGNLNIDIGGMGLLTIYARLLILFGTKAVLEIAECPEGTMVKIGAACTK